MGSMFATITYDDCVTIGGWVTATLVPALAAAGYWGRKAILNLLTFWSFLKDEYKAILTDRVLLRSIAAELRPNGGSSIRDAVTSIESETAKLSMSLSAVLDDQVYGSFEADVKGYYTRVNEEYLRMTDTDIDDIKHNGWLNFIVEADRGRIYREWHDSIDQVRDFDAVFTMRNQSTLEEFRVRCQTRAVKVASGRITGYFGTVRKLKSNDMRDEEAICTPSGSRKRKINTTEHNATNVDAARHNNPVLPDNQPDIDFDTEES